MVPTSCHPTPIPAHTRGMQALRQPNQKEYEPIQPSDRLTQGDNMGFRHGDTTARRSAR